jgi:hypothetical protein
MLAEYSDQGWKPLVRSGDSLPNGAQVSWVSNCFDANRRGDMAFIVQMNSGQAIGVRNADGVNNLVYVNSEPTAAGDLLTSINNFCSLSLLDDRRLYFTAVTSADRNVLYSAEPLNFPRSSVDLSSTDGGSDTASTPGNSPLARTGYARLSLNSGIAPSGTAVFSLTQNGVVVSETAVPASPPTTAARILVDYRSRVSAAAVRLGDGFFDVNTGIALVNMSSGTANVTFNLRNAAGSTIGIGHARLGPSTHVAKFVSQLTELAPDFRLPADFPSAIQFGSLEIASDQNLSVIALRLTVNQRGETLMTTTPVSNLDATASSQPVYFPHLADGGGYTTTLNLLNTSSSIETGRIVFYADDGAPLTIRQLAGPRDSAFPYVIQPGGAFVFQTGGESQVAVVGSVRLLPDANK